MASDVNSAGLAYPLTKMNFLVSVPDLAGAMAAFSEVTGIESTVDVIEFRQGNAHSLAPVKIPGLVKHGNITLKMGYTIGNGFKKWIEDCVSSTRGEMPRKEITIELLDIRDGSPSTAYTTTQGNVLWMLKDAWVCKYSGPDLNASTSEVAIETVEIAYEELSIPD